MGVPALRPRPDVQGMRGWCVLPRAELSRGGTSSTHLVHEEQAAGEGGCGLTSKRGSSWRPPVARVPRPKVGPLDTLNTLYYALK